VLGCFRRIRGRAEDRRLWRLNWPTLLHSLGGRISLFTDNAVIALLLSPRLVTPFFLTQRLALLVQGQLQGIGNATWAGLAELHARGQRAAFNDRLIELTKLVALFGVAIMLPIAALTGSFVSLWVGSAQFAGESIALLAAVNGVLLAIFSLWGWVFTGTGRIGALVPLQLIGAAINLACSVAATILVGAPGPLLGTLVMYVGYTGWKLPLLLRSHFGTPLQSLAIAVMGPIALGVPYAIALHVAEQRLSMDSWLALGTAAGASALAFLIIAWAAVLSGTERARWRERAAAVFATWTCPTPLRGPALMTTDRR
jgi:O-antigen/teichoic acid export membrane protein